MDIGKEASLYQRVKIIMSIKSMTKLYIKLLIFVISILLISCSFSNKKQCAIKDSSGKCTSELQAYKDSFNSNNEINAIPLSIRAVSNNDSNSKKEESNSNYYPHKTWVAEHTGPEKIVTGAHYIYW